MIELTHDEYLAFVEALANPRPPTQALVEAARKYQRQFWEMDCQRNIDQMSDEEFKWFVRSCVCPRLGVDIEL